MRFKDRVAFISGAGASSPGWSNGKAVSVLLAREGAKIFALDRAPEFLAETIEAIEAEGGECAAHTADVTQEADVKAAVAQCMEKFGRIDILFNNVGLQALGGPEEIEEEVWDRLMNANVKSMYPTCRHLLPVMVRQQRGVIVNNSSMAAISFLYPSIAYSSSKGAVDAFTRNLAVQYAGKGIRVVAVRPGLMATPRITNRMIVTDMAIKLMPGGHPFHAIAEAAANAATAGNVDPREVETITISAAQMRDWGSKSHPRDLVGAAHSVVYFVAAAVADRRFDWEHMTEAKMADPLIATLQDKVVFDQNPTPLPDRFTHRHGGTVTITTRSGGSFSNTCKAPRGSGPRGIEWGDMDGKYRRLAALSGFSSSQVDASLELLIFP